MKKNGFTLIELLAVIVVLSIVLLVAIPKIGDIVNQSRKSTFLEEAKNVYKMAQIVLVDGISTDYIYSGDSTKLDLNGNELDYCIRLNSEGSISSIVVSNGKYYVEGDSNFKQLDVSSVVEDSNYVVSCN